MLPIVSVTKTVRGELRPRVESRDKVGLVEPTTHHPSTGSGRTDECSAYSHSRSRGLLPGLYRAFNAATAHRLHVGKFAVGEAELHTPGSEVPYEDVLNRVDYGSPEEVVEKIQAYREQLGITGVSLDVNPGGQIPYEQVVNSIRLITEKVMPAFK